MHKARKFPATALEQLELNTLQSRCVVIESPFAGNIPRNTKYAALAMRDSFDRGELPFASHMIYPWHGVLNEDLTEDRKLGISAGFAWGMWAKTVAIYVDLGYSTGMHNALLYYASRGKNIVTRRLFLDQESMLNAIGPEKEPTDET